MSLVIKDLEVAYGRTQVLFGVSLEVPDDALVCMMGRNGVGQVDAPQRPHGAAAGPGRLDLLRRRRHHRPAAVEARRQAGIGYVPQGHQVFPHLTVRENLQVVLEALPGRRNDKSAIDDALDVLPGAAAVPQQARRPAVGWPGPAARHRPGPGRPGPACWCSTSRPRASSRRSSSRSRTRSSSSTGSRGMSILLVEQYVEFALRIAQRYAVMDGGTDRASPVTSPTPTRPASPTCSGSDAALAAPVPGPHDAA